MESNFVLKKLQFFLSWMNLNNEWIFQTIYGEIILQFHKCIIISKNQFMNGTHYNGKIMC